MYLIRKKHYFFELGPIFEVQLINDEKHSIYDLLRKVTFILANMASKKSFIFYKNKILTTITIIKLDLTDFIIPTFESKKLCKSNVFKLKFK